MKYLVTAEEMKEYDRNTIERIGIPGMVLMERAALAALGEIRKIMKKCRDQRKRVLILTGMGNNGGDGLALARLLAEESWEVEIWHVGERKKASPQWEKQSAILQNYPVKTGSKPFREEYTILIDALFGVGLSREVKGEFAQAIETFNSLSGYKIALDVPSGIDSDTGRVLGTAVRADMTVTFGFLKRGLALYPGCLYCGEVKVDGVGIGEASFFGRKPQMFCYDEDAESLLPPRDMAGNKGTFGKVVLAAGSRNMAGAAVLAARAAYRIGAGMVKVITPEENRVILQQQVPEALLGSPKELLQSLKWADVIVAGPGLSTGKQALELLRSLIFESSLPLVLDADALNLLSEENTFFQELSRQGAAGRRMILTPHVGELSRLMGKTIQELKENLPDAGVRLAERLHAVLVVKDARTFVCREDGTVCVNLAGNSGMATAGSGDVLAGVIAGLCAQGMEPFEAAAAGVCLHARAGDKAACRCGEHGLMAGDIIENMAFCQDTQRKEIRWTNGTRN